MKIALLTDGVYPYVIGGMQKFAFQLVKQLVNSGHEVYLFHCNKSKYYIEKLEFFSNKEKERIKPFVIPFPKISKLPFHYFYESYQYASLLAGALSKVVANIDFIFAQGFCASALPEISQRKNFPPVVVHLHGLEMFQSSTSLKAGASKYMYRSVVKQNLKKADYTISFGGKITPILNKFMNKEQIWEIPGGIEDGWFNDNKNKTGPIKFVFVGRYERRKGITELHAVLTKLLPLENFTFDFIGNIPGKQKIMSEKIHYHGELSKEDEIKEILRHSDVLVCPSYAEGMPYVIMEAMACGMAIVATDVGAVSLLVNKDNGWLLPRPNVDKLFNTMLQIIHDKRELIEQKKLNSSKKIKNFTIEKVTNQLVTYMEAARKKERAGMGVSIKP